MIVVDQDLYYRSFLECPPNTREKAYIEFVSLAKPDKDLLGVS